MSRSGLRVALLTLVLAYYVLTVGHRGVLLLRDGRWAFRGLGAGLLLLGAVGVALLVGELRFGRAAAELSRAAGDVRDEGFPAAQAAAEAAPDDWQAWYRLAIAYYGERDVRRARAAMRHAVALRRVDARRAA